MARPSATRSRPPAFRSASPSPADSIGRWRRRDWSAARTGSRSGRARRRSSGPTGRGR